MISRRLQVFSVLVVALLSQAAYEKSLGQQAGAAEASGSTAQISSQQAELPTGAVFTPPPPNECISSYDQFYATERGVYSYWPLCESTPTKALYDYVGIHDLVRNHGAWGGGTINSAPSGPVGDNEPYAEVPGGGNFIEAQGVVLNSHAGTLAAWISTDPLGPSPVSLVYLAAIHGKSSVTLSASSKADKVCFTATLTDTAGTKSTIQDDCTTQPDAWKRIVLTWSDSKIQLFVNGRQQAEAPRSPAFDDLLFYYRFFPPNGSIGKRMGIAKVSLANVAWTPDAVAADFHPSLRIPPAGGILVTDEPLGTIHQDVLGFQDNNAKISDPGVRSAMLAGLGAAGLHSVRYSSGAMGIDADTVDWRGGPSCKGRGQTKDAPHTRTGNDLQSYFADIVKPLSLHAGYMVNYGSNPPDCTDGGSPIVNGADLVTYANIQHHLGIRYWEIGNEQYAGGASELDLHEKPGDGASYATEEVKFYDAMKARDPSIKIGVPVAAGLYSLETNWSFPVLRNARYDAAIVHSYPMRDPISDGSTLYPDRVASNLGRTAGSLLHFQTMLLNAGADPSAIWITEWDGDVLGNKWSKQSLGAVMPLFATMQLANFMNAGVRYATWLEQGGSDGCYYYNFDESAYSSYSWVKCGGTFVTYTGPVKGEFPVGLKPGDLSPPARAFQLLSLSGFISEGEKMVRVVSDPKGAPWLIGYAATHKGSYAVILINRDRDRTVSVPVSFFHNVAGGAVEQWTYGREQYDGARTGNWEIPPVHAVLSRSSKIFEAKLPPWSVNILVFR